VPSLRSPVQQPETGDEELVLRAQEDPRAFEHLFQKYHAKIFRFLALRTASRELAEDLAAQTFLNALEHLDRYRPTAPFSAWLYRIARNLLVDSYRVSGRTVQLDEALDLGFDAGIVERAERSLQRDALHGALRQLTDTEREVLLLRVNGDLTHAEIASALGKSEAAVKVAYMRAVQHLRTLLPPPPTA